MFSRGCHSRASINQGWFFHSPRLCVFLASLQCPRYPCLHYRGMCQLPYLLHVARATHLLLGLLYQNGNPTKGEWMMYCKNISQSEMFKKLHIATKTEYIFSKRRAMNLQKTGKKFLNFSLD